MKKLLPENFTSKSLTRWHRISSQFDSLTSNFFPLLNPPNDPFLNKPPLLLQATRHKFWRQNLLDQANKKWLYTLGSALRRRRQMESSYVSVCVCDNMDT